MVSGVKRVTLNSPIAVQPFMPGVFPAALCQCMRNADGRPVPRWHIIGTMQPLLSPKEI